MRQSDIREVSAGRVVLNSYGHVLMVQVKNLKKQIRWTFPKGHLERKETTRCAAVREVQEETGWRCRISNFILRVRYQFCHRGRMIHKTVHWFKMTPIRKVGRPDPIEIRKVRWVTFELARKLAVYESDQQILKLLEEDDE